MPTPSNHAGWFEQHFGAVPDPLVPTQHLFSIGDTVVLDLANPSAAWLTYDLEVVEGEIGLTDQSPFRERLLELFSAGTVERLEIPPERNRRRVTPVALERQTADCEGRIVCRPVRYATAKTFLNAVAVDETLRDAIRDQDPGFGSQAPVRPGILFGNVAVITDGMGDEPHLLLVQKATRAGGQHFNSGQWAASMGEQFDPAWDHTIQDMLTRGLDEELGLMVPNGIDCLQAALFLERCYWNFGVAGLSFVDLSLASLERYWRGARDFNENAQIAALPLREDLVRECLETGILTKTVRAACVVPDSLRVGFDKTTGWVIHPNSLFMMTLALWAVTAWR